MESAVPAGIPHRESLLARIEYLLILLPFYFDEDFSKLHALYRAITADIPPDLAEIQSSVETLESQTYDFIDAQEKWGPLMSIMLPNDCPRFLDQDSIEALPFQLKPPTSDQPRQSVCYLSDKGEYCIRLVSDETDHVLEFVFTKTQKGFQWIVHHSRLGEFSYPRDFNRILAVTPQQFKKVENSSVLPNEETNDNCSVGTWLEKCEECSIEKLRKKAEQLILIFEALQDSSKDKLVRLGKQHMQHLQKCLDQQQHTLLYLRLEWAWQFLKFHAFGVDLEYFTLLHSVLPFEHPLAQKFSQYLPRISDLIASTEVPLLDKGEFLDLVTAIPTRCQDALEEFRAQLPERSDMLSPQFPEAFDPLKIMRLRLYMVPFDLESAMTDVFPKRSIDLKQGSYFFNLYSSEHRFGFYRPSFASTTWTILDEKGNEICKFDQGANKAVILAAIPADYVLRDALIQALEELWMHEAYREAVIDFPELYDSQIQEILAANAGDLITLSKTVYNRRLQKLDELVTPTRTLPISSEFYSLMCGFLAAIPVDYEDRTPLEQIRIDMDLILFAEMILARKDIPQAIQPASSDPADTCTEVQPFFPNYIHDLFPFIPDLAFVDASIPTSSEGDSPYIPKEPVDLYFYATDAFGRLGVYLYAKQDEEDKPCYVVIRQEKRCDQCWTIWVGDQCLGTLDGTNHIDSLRTKEKSQHWKIFDVVRELAIEKMCVEHTPVSSTWTAQNIAFLCAGILIVGLYTLAALQTFFDISLLSTMASLFTGADILGAALLIITAGASIGLLVYGAFFAEKAAPIVSEDQPEYQDPDALQPDQIHQHGSEEATPDRSATATPVTAVGEEAATLLGTPNAATSALTA